MEILQVEGVEIRNSASKGRGLYATKSFQEEEVVFEESPLVSCQFPWNQDFEYKACDHCMRPLETAQENVRRLGQLPDAELPLPDTFTDVTRHTSCECQVTYCSAECRQMAAVQYHNVLCASPGSSKAKSLKKLREVWKQLHYPPESATILIVLRIYAYVFQANDKPAAISKFQQFVSDSSNPRVCEKLLGRFQDKVHILRNSVAECVQSLNLDIPQELLTPEGFLTTLSILALNGQGIGTSSFARWIQILDDTDQSNVAIENFINGLYRRLEDTVGLQFLNNEGVGLYQLQSKINHSCEPNMEVIFPHNNHVVGIRALRAVEPEEELTITYIDECKLKRSRHTRQNLLREKYLFQCLCPKCEAQVADPDETSDDDDFDDGYNVCTD